MTNNNNWLYLMIIIDQHMAYGTLGNDNIVCNVSTLRS